MATRRITADKLKKLLYYFFVLVFLLSGTLYYYIKGETQAPGFADWADEYAVAGLEVHFIDVGQGDCTLLLCGETAILVDGGEYEYGREIVNYLKQHGVEKLELLVATHRHSDHIGGLQPVLERMLVDEVLVNSRYASGDVDSYAWNDFNYDVQLNGAAVSVADNSMTYQFGELVLDVLAGYSDMNDENEQGIILRCEYEGCSVLLTGDIGEISEQALLASDVNVDCDILKVAHHGSLNSSCADFLSAATPQIAVISCGENNVYGHPDHVVLQRLQDVGSTVYRTDKNGTIVFSCMNNTIELISDGKDD